VIVVAALSSTAGSRSQRFGRWSPLAAGDQAGQTNLTLGRCLDGRPSTRSAVAAAMAPRFRQRMDHPTGSIQDLVFQVVGELGLADPVVAARRYCSGTDAWSEGDSALTAFRPVGLPTNTRSSSTITKGSCSRLCISARQMARARPDGVLTFGGNTLVLKPESLGREIVAESEDLVRAYKSRNPIFTTEVRFQAPSSG
jgi:hypothetical protein